MSPYGFPLSKAEMKMAGEKILIVDDEKVLCNSLKLGLEDEGYKVEVAFSGEEALRVLIEFEPHLALVDLRLPKMDGIEVLKKMKEWEEDILVIMITAYGDTQTTVNAIKVGAYNYINKPFNLDELKVLIGQALSTRSLRQEVEYFRFRQRKYFKFGEMVGESSCMKKIYKKINFLAKADSSTVLIQGESGTGKELAAIEIHFKSRRAKRPFMEISCATLQESLLESEIFGYEKGAFTDARAQKKGLFELADGGTIFLDEIGEISPVIQAKLLRFLEKKKFKRVGGYKDIQVDVRVIAATNRDLKVLMDRGRFREDLYYRLNVVNLTLPPLYERKGDIVLLANFFLDKFCQELGKGPMNLSSDVIDVLNRYNWRGNVRELRNVIERAIIFSKQKVIGKELIPKEMLQGEGLAGRDHGIEKREEETLEEVINRYEKTVIEDALKRTHGNITHAARLLGISRFSLMRRRKKLIH